MIVYNGSDYKLCNASQSGGRSFFEHELRYTFSENYGVGYYSKVEKVSY